MQPDARRGARIYAAVCVVCHGENGQGGTAPALNDPTRLEQFDGAWYAEAIASGRLEQGMPVWRGVLSPQQIGDLVALLDAWRRGEEITFGDVASLLRDAAHAVEHGELDEAVELLEQAADSAEHERAEVIERALNALRAGNIQEATNLIEQAQGMEEGMPALGEGAPSSAAPIDPGVAHLQEAAHALEQGDLEEAGAALGEALELLPPGDLKEVAEHALEDIGAGKPEEALGALERALEGIP
jgi:tetratricopeptide (TPR) repeat protein